MSAGEGKGREGNGAACAIMHGSYLASPNLVPNPVSASRQAQDAIGANCWAGELIRANDRWTPRHYIKTR